MKFLRLRVIRIFVLLIIIAVIFTQTPWGQGIFRNQAYAVGDLTVDWGTAGIGNVGPIFSVSNMKPGDSQSRSVTIHNGSANGRPVAIKGVKTDETGNLSTALLLQIKDGPTVLYSNSLASFFTDSMNPEGIALNTISPGDDKTYTFTVTFQQSAGNEFQNTSTTFTIVIGIAFTLPSACKNINLNGKFPIFGTSGNDVLQGTSKADIILGLEGNDRISGVSNNDCLVGGPGNDQIDGGSGNDQLIGNEGNDTFTGDSGNDHITGDAGNDTADGGAGNDSIEGGDGVDTLLGGSGNDRLDGQAGADSNNGQTGRDTCSTETSLANCEVLF